MKNQDTPFASTIVVATNDSRNQAGANYVCDGTDDHLEIQAAIDSLPVGGGRVTLLEGNYNIAIPIVLKSNTELAGQGWNTLLFLVANSDCHMIINDLGASNIIIRDLAVDGNKENQTVTTLRGIFPHDGTNFQILNCYAKNCTMYNIDVGLCYDVLIDGCMAVGSGYQGFVISKAGRVTITNCISNDNGYAGIAVWWTTQVQVIGNRLTNNGLKCISSGIDYGAIDVRGTPDDPNSISSETTLLIANNNIFKTQSHGIKAVSGIDGINICGNMISECGEYAGGAAGIFVAADTNGDVSNVSIVNNKISDIYTSGIQFSSYGSNVIRGVTVTDNNIRHCRLDGIVVSRVSQGVISDNVIYNYDKNASFSRWGILVSTNCTEINVLGNNIDNPAPNAQYAIRIAYLDSDPNVKNVAIGGNIVSVQGSGDIKDGGFNTQIYRNIIKS